MTNKRYVEILPSVTTLDTDWSSQIDEVIDLNLTEIGLFLTMADVQERSIIYSKLEKIPNLKVPFVHLRDEMSPEEIKYLKERFSTSVFNSHSEKSYPPHYDWTPYLKEIYLENAGDVLNAEELQKYAGICLDISHLEDDRLVRPDVFRTTLDLMKKFPVGCGHISAISAPTRMEDGLDHHDHHHVKSLSDLDYLKRYVPLFPSLLALEVDNSIKEQLSFKNHITGLMVGSTGVILRGKGIMKA